MTRIELLTSSHNREAFDCGCAPLNLFLKQTAGQHARRGISRTYVLVADDAVEPKDILGFFSLNLCQVKADELPPEHEKKFPREVGAVRLGRLAVSKLRQRQGLGTVLLVAALNKAMDVFRTAGGVGLFVDAKDIPAKEYYERFGFISLPANELQLFLPIKTIAALLSER